MLVFILFINFIYTVYALYKRSKQDPKKREYWIAVIIVGMLYGFILVGIHHRVFVEDLTRCLGSIFGRPAPSLPTQDEEELIFFSHKNQTYYLIVFKDGMLRINSQVRKDGSDLWIRIAEVEATRISSLDEVIVD